jgi:hypothetical protein
MLKLLEGEEGGGKWVQLKWLQVHVIPRPPKNDLSRGKKTKVTYVARE